jgi:glutamate--cysteine ligase
MAVASRLAVARVSPDGARPAAAAAAGGRGRSGLAAVRLPSTAGWGRRRGRGGAVAASPPTEEAVQMTEPLTKEDLVAYLVSGCKPKENWRSEASVCSFFLIFVVLFWFLS